MVFKISSWLEIINYMITNQIIKLKLNLEISWKMLKNYWYLPLLPWHISIICIIWVRHWKSISVFLKMCFSDLQNRNLGMGSSNLYFNLRYILRTLVWECLICYVLHLELWIEKREGGMLTLFSKKKNLGETNKYIYIYNYKAVW